MKRLLIALAGCVALCTHAATIRFESEQITQGPKHHMFGYIGHVGTIPWNGSGRYILALEIDSIDSMPGGDDVARVMVIDTTNAYATTPVAETRAWNPQQGTMFYWNPASPTDQFFFNDRDPATGKIFTVLYDISDGLPGKRIREYRFADRPVANSGVAQHGGFYMAINYGRLARLRPVTGYRDAFDWTTGVTHPADDGVFRVDVESGACDLVVSYAELAEALRPALPQVEGLPLFINHTLCSRDDGLVYFFVRGGWDGSVEASQRINASFTMRPDGSGLAYHPLHIGGHPEWLDGRHVIGRKGDLQVLYDVEKKEIVGAIGDAATFKNPEGDIALSPDGTWFVNGFRAAGGNRYTVYRMEDGLTATSDAFGIGGRASGDLRIDPSPRWNRAGNAFLVPGIAADGTRQLFIVRMTVTE